MSYQCKNGTLCLPALQSVLGLGLRGYGGWGVRRPNDFWGQQGQSGTLTFTSLFKIKSGHLSVKAASSVVLTGQSWTGPIKALRQDSGEAPARDVEKTGGYCL